MALINTTTTGVLGTTVFADGSGDLTIQQNGAFVNKITSNGLTNRGTGSVLQVATSTLSTDFSTTSISYVDTGLSVSVTPTSSSSRFLLLANMSMTGGAGGVVMFYQFVRNSTAVGIGTQVGASNAATGAVYNDPGVGSGNQNSLFMYTNANYIDSPSTTSAVTYKIQVRNNTDGTAVYLNRRNDNYITAISTLTVMEIAG
jgi:hypothetical protein